MVRPGLCLLLLLAVLTACRPSSPTPSPAPSPLAPGTIVGVVRDAEGPVAGATVRVQATDNKTTTTADGSFVLGLTTTTPVSVTAWAEGYFVGWISAVSGAGPVTITLKPYYTTDNPDYAWFSMEGAEGSRSCSHCMPAYEEWVEDAHSQSAVNPRFLTMYNGTDVDGNRSPPARYVYNRNYGFFPVRPDPDEPYYGPGYRLDFPNTAGNCATCHVPAAAAYPGRAYSVDPNQVSGIEAEGVFCEFCHKIGDVILDPATGLPYPNRPGVLSLRLYRPGEGQQLFFGNFDDVTRRVSYLPLEEESSFCAPCHFGVFWDTLVYNSFGEWLDSPYSDPETGRTCQDCHMPIAGYDYFVFPEKGGLRRDPNRIFSHRMPGASDEAFLQNAVAMTATAWLEEGTLVVEVSITNDRTGHYVPTGSPLRHLILTVQAIDGQGQALPQQGGPTVPEWGGPQAGQPGKAFAKVLETLWTEISPTSAYWNPTRVLSDNRLAPFATDVSTYTFDAPEEGLVRVEVTLLYRRAFARLMEQKGWDVPDIVMEEQGLEVVRP
ncbi:MAG TPA: carboxypeptidase regulatory-like domain-containing protein [Thermoflexia bacterium]|nr:carboxypeptidase regulatory-like domain-containing protein [Thermoflexia bacterium]